MKKEIKLLVSDVDGVLTNGLLYWTAEGNYMKVFHYRDGLGFKDIKAKGIKTAFVSAGPAKEVLESRGKHLKIDYVYADIKEKVSCVEAILKKENLEWQNLAYIGDDSPDLECLKKAGFSFCPSDAVEEIKAIVDVVLKTKGGEGCIRELSTYL